MNKCARFIEIILLSLKKIKIKIKINSSPRFSLQYHIVGSILVLNILKNILAHVKLIYTRKIFQRHDETQDTNTFKMFVAKIGNAKNVDGLNFHIDAQMLKYCQNISNSCYFISLVSTFDSIYQINSANDISKRIEEALTSRIGFRNRINFANSVLKNKKIVKGEHKLYYNLNMYRQKGYFNIFNNIGEHSTLLPLMDYLRNLNHAISVVGYWMFDSKYEKALFSK